jgi:hypothetical protein
MNLAGSSIGELTFETFFAKEARGRLVLVGKTPRLFHLEVNWGLQYGLSGNPALYMATLQCRA